jgi:hypothetical protein
LDTVADDGLGGVPALLPFETDGGCGAVEPCFDAAFEGDGDLTAGFVCILDDGYDIGGNALGNSTVVCA